MKKNILVIIPTILMTILSSIAFYKYSKNKIVYNNVIFEYHIPNKFTRANYRFQSQIFIDGNFPTMSLSDKRKFQFLIDFSYRTYKYLFEKDLDMLFRSILAKDKNTYKKEEFNLDLNHRRNSVYFKITGTKNIERLIEEFNKYNKIATDKFNDYLKKNITYDLVLNDNNEISIDLFRILSEKNLYGLESIILNYTDETKEIKVYKFDMMLISKILEFNQNFFKDGFFINDLLINKDSKIGYEINNIFIILFSIINFIFFYIIFSIINVLRKNN